MLRLVPTPSARRPLRVLCIGAHSDDIEIGCGSTLMTWFATLPKVDVTWVVLSAAAVRGREARRSARALLRRATVVNLALGPFRDGFLLAQYSEVKEFFERLKSGNDPDIILTHHLQDRHQDHRLAAELTWNTWRNHLVIEYEIPKYEGDLAQPNAYMPVSERSARRKVTHLDRYFGSQRGKGWFLPDNFLALMRIRGIECRAPSGYAEAFHVRKFVL